MAFALEKPGAGLLEAAAGRPARQRSFSALAHHWFQRAAVAAAFVFIAGIVAGF